MPLAGPQQERVFGGPAIPFLRELPKLASPRLTWYEWSRLDSEGHASEEGEVPCVPSPSSLIDAELETKWLVGVVWRNVSSENTIGSGQRNDQVTP